MLPAAAPAKPRSSRCGELNRLFGAVDTTTVIGLRDRALIGVMFYTFASISGVLGMDVRDLVARDGEMWCRLTEKANTDHGVALHPSPQATSPSI